MEILDNIQENFILLYVKKLKYWIINKFTCTMKSFFFIPLILLGGTPPILRQKTWSPEVFASKCGCLSSLYLDYYSHIICERTHKKRFELTLPEAQDGQGLGYPFFLLLKLYSRGKKFCLPDRRWSRLMSIKTDIEEANDEAQA